MKHVIFTICSNNYFAQAIVLGKSLAASNPQCTFYVCVADCKVRDVDYSTVQNVLFVDELLIPTFEQMVQKYSIVELNTAIKPYMFSYLFQKEYDCDMVTYLDPDIYVYKSLELIESLIKDYNFILTPHTTSPYPLDGNIPNEEDILNTGMYNLGYISIKNNVEGQNMVRWWEERLRDKADIDFNAGHFTDQIWINFVPLYFSKVCIFRNLGYNVAYWNLHERNIVSCDDNIFIQKEQEIHPLVFFHFSGYNPFKPIVFSKYQSRITMQDGTILMRLCKQYGNNLLNNNYLHYSQIECYYQKRHDEHMLTERMSQLRKLSFIQRKYRGLLLVIRDYINSKLGGYKHIMETRM